MAANGDRTAQTTARQTENAGYNMNQPSAPGSFPWWRSVDSRTWIGIILILTSILGISALSMAAIVFEQDDRTAVTQQIMNAVLPLFGSWVGTILAFSFARDNFEAATRSAKELTRGTSVDQKLQSLPVADHMLLVGNIFSKTYDPSLKLVELMYELTAASSKKRQDWSRIPIFDSKGAAKYVIHRSMIDRFAAAQALEEKDIKALTLGELEKDQAIEDIISSFGVVKRGATLADARLAMLQSRHAQDVFITEDGSLRSPAIGWITNVMITEQSQV